MTMIKHNFVLSTRTLVLVPFLIITLIVMLLSGVTLYVANETLSAVSTQLQRNVDVENFLSELEAVRTNIVYQSNEAFQAEVSLNTNGPLSPATQKNFYQNTLELQLTDYLTYLDEIKLRPIAKEPAVQSLLNNAINAANNDMALAQAMRSHRPLSEIQSLRVIWSKSASETEALMSDLIAANQHELGIKNNKLVALKREFRNLEICLLLALAASYLVKYVLIRRFVLLPLAQFDAKVQSNLKSGTFETLGITDPTEIGRLARAFDQLMILVSIDEDNLRALAADRSKAAEEAKNALHALQKAKDGLVRSEKLSAVGTMVGGVAHEISNPLMGLMAYLEQLAGSCESEKQKELVGKAQGQIARIERIVKNMLVFAHTPASHDKVEPAALLSPITLVCELLEPLRKQSNAQFVQQIPKDLPKVLMTTDKLQQILLNLVKNALESMTANRAQTQPTVWIQAESIQGMVHVHVADNGPGVSDTTVSHLFEPFFTTKDPNQGTGLGLAISLQLAEEAGGTIQFQQREGGGAVFTLVLPGEPTS